MAEGGEGEDEIQFLRTVSNAALPEAAPAPLETTRRFCVRDFLLWLGCHLTACFPDVIWSHHLW